MTTACHKTSVATIEVARVGGSPAERALDDLSAEEPLEIRLAASASDGRHNALEKLIGSELRAGRIPLAGGLVLVSGRVSFELVQKAAVAGVPMLAAVGAPSSLAVDMGREC